MFKNGLKLSIALSLQISACIALSFAYAGEFPKQSDGADTVNCRNLLRKPLSKMIVSGVTHPIAKFHFQTSAQTIKGTFLQPDDIARSRESYRREDLSDKQKAKESFKIYLSARLRGSSPTVKRLVNEYLRTAQVSATRSFSAQHFQVGPQRDHAILTINMPASLIGTEIFYFVMAHETEHLLQDLRLIAAISANKQPYLDNQAKHRLKQWYKEILDHAAEDIFVREMGAMAAEFHYLRLVSPEQLEKALLMTWNEHDPSVRRLSNLLKMHLNSSSFELRGIIPYLLKNWQSDRYSLQNSISNANAKRKKAQLPPKNFHQLNVKVIAE